MNAPLIFTLPGATMADPNRWQPLAFSYLVLQNGIIVGASVQDFVCPHWASVAPVRRATDGHLAYMDRARRRCCLAPRTRSSRTSTSRWWHFRGNWIRRMA